MNEKNESPTNLQTALDCAARDFEGKTGGYVINDVSYLNYMTNEDWKSFCEGIAENHKSQFEEGSGGELSEKMNHGTLCPPKMASYGSSSRLIYELSKDIEDFSFEEQLPTRVGGIANLDGFLKKQSEYIYVEAKKREIYGASHENEIIKTAYLGVYDSIHDACPSFEYDKVDDKKADYSKVTFKIDGVTVKYFDLKQLICHFLGITYDIVKHNIQRANVSFLYLLYNPNEIKVCIDEKYREMILKRYDEVQKMISENIENGFFNKVFDAVLDYQVEKHNLNKPEITFKIELVDQNNYRERIESK